MKREEFVFTIGYQGQSAIVDGQAMKKYKSLSTRDLAEKGLFKEAFCSALFSGRKEETQIVLKQYNKVSGTAILSEEELMRLFGVFGIPEGITKSNVLS